MNVVTFCVWLVSFTNLFALDEKFIEKLSEKPAIPEWLLVFRGIVDIAVIVMLVMTGHWVLGIAFLISCGFAGAAIDESSRIRNSRVAAEANVPAKKAKKSKVTKIKV